MKLNNEMEDRLSKQVKGNLSSDKKNINPCFNEFLIYQKQIKEKQRLIVELKGVLENEELKVKSYEAKFESINRRYSEFQEYKEELRKNTNYVQENLIVKEERINELEKSNLEKEDELIGVRKKILDQEIAIRQYEEEINILKNHIDSMKINQLCVVSKSKVSFLKRIFDKWIKG